MTAFSNPSDFVLPSSQAAGTAGSVRPNLAEFFWGYEITMNEQIVDLAGLMRGAAVLIALAAFVAAFAVWLVPAMAFTGSAIVAKATASLVFWGIGAALVPFAARSTRVRVQVDRSTGELREVVSGVFGGTVLLSNYGLDTVADVKVVSSRIEPALGQVQITLKSGDVIAAGDGATTLLTDLRDRLVSDCGLESQRTSRETIWSGPLAA